MTPEQIAAVAGKETWRPIAGFEGSYEVSDLGRVRSLDRVVITSDRREWRQHGRVLVPGFTRKGYLCVRLYKGNVGFSREVHRLVCIAFHGEPDGRQVRHINGLRTDNRAANLQWGTVSENALDKWGHGTMLHGERAPWSKLTADSAREICRRSMHESKRGLAREFGVDESAIRMIVNGKRWAAETLAVRDYLKKEARL